MSEDVASSMNRDHELLKLQYEEAGKNFRAAWDLYLKFYVAFIALNFTAIMPLGVITIKSIQ